ncbi:MAG TPA: crossover junction endodeoxyribonuclease RuvC [Coxiellaceae bacterium]|nr:crossover junction endodeoxyribonuclease RuvC [Coxiellaceae bacterium]
MIILGIDPGSIHTGFGIIKADKNQLSAITHGVIHACGDTIAARLHDIYTRLSDIIAQYRPDEAAIETVFMKVNVQSALKLGQARGAALVALAKYALPVSEYAARVVKKTATGYGAADKTQMQFMMRVQLKLTKTPEADAADALAIALCHAQHSRAFSQTRLGVI